MIVIQGDRVLTADEEGVMVILTKPELARIVEKRGDSESDYHVIAIAPEGWTLQEREDWTRKVVDAFDVAHKGHGYGE
jgi:hypothetical protein